MALLNQVLQKLNTARFTPVKQQGFLEDLAALIDDGVSAHQAVEMMLKISTGITAQCLDGIMTSLAEGRQFADGLSNWFPPHIVEMIRAGESAGTLTRAMRAAAETLSQKNQAISSLLASLTYPIIVLLVACGVIVFFNHFIFADFKSILPVTQWPLHAQMLVGVGYEIEHWWWLWLLLLIIVVSSAAFILRDYNGEFRPFLDRFPLLSIYRELIAARLMQTLALLIGNGMVLKQALAVLKDHANPYLSSHLLSMEYRLGAGTESIGDVLNTGLINPNDILRLRLVIRNKSFESALLRLGQQASRNCIQRIVRAGRVGAGMCLLIGAALAAFMIFSVYDVGAILGAGLS